MQKAKEQKENNKKTTNQRRNVRKGFMFAQGITIIALVITIIILLILAGIVLNLALGNNGLFSMAKSAVEKYKISANEESELFEELDKNFIVGNNKLPIRTQIIGYIANSANCDNTISLIHTAKGALEENKAMIERIMYLINGIDEGDEQSKIPEIQALESEIDYICKTTQANSIKIFDNPIKIYYDNINYEEILLEPVHTQIDFSTNETIKKALVNLQDELEKINTQTNELNKKEETLEKIRLELNKKIEDLSKLEYLDNIELPQVELNGELEIEKIEVINQMLKNLDDINNLLGNSEEKIGQIHYKLVEIHELLILPGSGSISEANTKKEEIDLIANEIEIVNETVTIDSKGEKITIKISNLNTNYLGKDNTPLYLDISNIEKTKESIENAIEIVSYERSNVGAIKNRAEHVRNYYTKIKEVLENKIKNKEDRNKRLAFVSLKEVQYCLDDIRKLMITSQTQEGRISKYSIKIEIDQILLEINRIATHTTIEDDVGLLNGTWNKNINVTLNNLGIQEINNDTPENIESGIKKLEESIIKVYENRKALAK